MSHKYFIKSKNDNIAELCSDDSAHLAKVMRAKKGDKIILCDGAGNDYEAVLDSVTAEQTTAEIISSYKSVSEASVTVTIYVGLPKGDKLEFIIQKATELGADRIIPFESEFCIVKPKNEEKKVERYNKIAKEAAKQAGRSKIPVVEKTISFNNLCKTVNTYDVALFFYEKGGEKLFEDGRIHSRLGDAKSIALISGAEGGFSQAEADQAINAGCVPIGLGTRILRCETAPITALAVTMALTGNL